MGTDHPKSPTELRQYLALLQQRDDAGQPFIIVGGHAANFWAEFYSEREPRLKASLPFTSKDLDIIGTEDDARRVANAIGWNLSPPPVGGGPVQAVLSSEPGGAGLAVEFLSEIKGVSHQTIMDNVREGVVEIPTTGQAVTVRVLDPVLLMAGKIRNAVDIEQNQPDKPRQDLKHVATLALCVPHFLEDVRTQTTGRAEQKNICGKYITMLAALKNTYSGRQFEAQHPGVIHWPELIPNSIRQMPMDWQIQNSLRQLGGEGHSQGIRV
ncbi:MAG: hypothetical protein KJ070_13015 [Verrucomicrobia bacterium]|nr:hypothetical protein [Verrucomicrobiota bacterium]